MHVVLIIKRDNLGHVNKFKAWVVAREDHQLKRLNFDSVSWSGDGVYANFPHSLNMFFKRVETPTWGC